MEEKAQIYVKNYIDLESRSFNSFELIETIKKIIYPFEEIIRNQGEQDSHDGDFKFEAEQKNSYLQEVLLMELE
jgi:hypothetical protein